MKTIPGLNLDLEITKPYLFSNPYLSLIMHVFFTIEGLPQLQAYLGYLATGGLRKEVADGIVIPIFKQGTDKIRSDAPNRTGALRNSVTFEMGGGKGIICKIRIKAKHAGFKLWNS